MLSNNFFVLFIFLKIEEIFFVISNAACVRIERWWWCENKSLLVGEARQRDLTSRSLHASTTHRLVRACPHTVVAHLFKIDAFQIIDKKKKQFYCSNNEIFVFVVFFLQFATSWCTTAVTRPIPSPLPAPVLRPVWLR